ncbi:uncharacterized protein VTP21DRAFT_9470 [Calcarisporiella thermophila]|uniref:uncharacterized protein n=1 Tax=Calcarisporiella thermophila TaxID=911321 RepID=UPI0037433611
MWSRTRERSFRGPRSADSAGCWSGASLHVKTQSPPRLAARHVWARNPRRHRPSPSPGKSARAGAQDQSLPPGRRRPISSALAFALSHEVACNSLETPPPPFVPSYGYGLLWISVRNEWHYSRESPHPLFASIHETMLCLCIWAFPPPAQPSEWISGLERNGSVVAQRRSEPGGASGSSQLKPPCKGPTRLVGLIALRLANRQAGPEASWVPACNTGILLRQLIPKGTVGLSHKDGAYNIHAGRLPALSPRLVRFPYLKKRDEHGGDRG